MSMFPKVVTLLREKGAGDVLVFGGGIIPKDDIPKLEEAGIEKIFTPGASTGEIVVWLNERLSDHQASWWTLYEHQGKDLFERAGIPLPERAVATTTPQEAAEAAERLGGRVAVKVQVQMGGRGKGGGGVLVHSSEEAARRRGRPDAEEGFGGTPWSRACWSSASSTSPRSSRGDLSGPERRHLPRAGVQRRRHRGSKEVGQDEPAGDGRVHVHPVRGLRPLPGPPPDRASAARAVKAPRRIVTEVSSVLEQTDATLVATNPMADGRDGDGVGLEGHGRRQRAVPSARTSRR